MRFRIPLLVVLGLLFLVPTPLDAARHKVGPQTLRGIAVHLHRSSFTLQTRSRGSFVVLLSSATQISQKGKRGRASLSEGDHVGVHGFITGRSIRAITVRIYPVKPRPYDIRGVISGVQGPVLSVAIGGRTVSIHITGNTEIRIGSRIGRLRDLHSGERVQVRVQSQGGGLDAVRVHVYLQRHAGRHLVVRGTVVSVGGTLGVQAGTTKYTVRMAASTLVYRGRARSSARALKPGESVTVYACCAGRPLVATSVHIHASRVSHPALLLRGWITSLTPTSLTVLGGGKSVRVLLTGSTRYEVGTETLTERGVHIGDEVSVRAFRSGSTLIAERVHVYAASRLPHTVDGTISSVSAGTIEVMARTRRYRVVVSNGTVMTLNGHAVKLSGLRAGDRVHITGRLTGDASLTASRVVARRPVPKSPRVTIKGTLLWARGSSLAMMDTFGRHYQVHLLMGVAIHLHGKPAPGQALFTGVSITVRGHMAGTVLLASAVTISVTSRTVDGRITAVTSRMVLVQRSSGETVHIDVPAGLSVQDGANRLPPAHLHTGAYLRAAGYDEPSGAVRAIALHILHLALDTSATVTQAGSEPVVTTSRGQRYRLHLSPHSEITTGRTGIALESIQIPVGCRVHLVGTVRTDGAVAVTLLEVRLESATLRGTVVSVTADKLTLQAASGTIDVLVRSQTILAQGSHSLRLSDLVAGDDVTVYGYAGAGSVVFARKVLVHRRLEGLDGTITTITASGFTLNSAAGSVQIVIQETTVYTGGGSSTLQPGAAVHVTGYRRGDGSILATRVRFVKHSSALRDQVRLQPAPVNPYSRLRVRLNPSSRSS